MPIHYQLSPAELTDQSVKRGEGVLNDTGALVIKTGSFTGRSPKDKFTVKDELTADTVDWNDFNIAMEEKYFFRLKEKIVGYLKQKELWIRDCFACADENYTLTLRVIN
jgi:phosphoenolpyruvate carboxykinase (ATP)